MIKYKGYAVFAREVEEVIISHPEVKYVGVIGVPNPQVGQLIKAVIVLETDARGCVLEKDIINYCELKVFMINRFST